MDFVIDIKTGNRSGSIFWRKAFLPIERPDYQPGASIVSKVIPNPIAENHNFMAETYYI